MKTKVVTGLGALVVAMSTVGVVAYADTTTNGISTGATVTQSKTARSAYAGQIKSEIQRLKSLQVQRKQLNQQLKADVQTLKGKHVRKTDPADFQAIKATHRKVLAERAKLHSDRRAVRADLASKNWSKAVTDLQTDVADLQNMVNLKQQQVNNVQNAMSHVGGTSTSPSAQTGSSGLNA